MKKKLLILLLFFINYNIYSQQKMDITNESRYELRFKEYKNQKEELVNTFILLFNTKESFLKNMSIYVKDSLIENGKIKLTGEQDDMSVNMRFSTELPLTIHTKGNEISFSNEIVYVGELNYKETADFNWKLSKEIKIINGIKCKKATTTKWGRNWIAYYSPKHPLPFGPYKFHGLPGLIFEVGDDQKEYIFTLYKFKNRKKDNFLLHNYQKPKKVTKSQYEKARHDAATKPFEGTIKGDPGLGKRITKRRLEKEKNYNPIELID